MERRPTPEGDLTKLPRWAQRYIATLTRQLDRAEEYIHGDEGPCIAVADPNKMASAVARRSTDVIRWALFGDYGEEPRDYIDVSRDQEGRVTVRGSSSLLMAPSVSNTVYVTVSEPIHRPTTPKGH